MSDHDERLREMARKQQPFPKMHNYRCACGQPGNWHLSGGKREGFYCGDCVQKARFS